MTDATKETDYALALANAEEAREITRIKRIQAEETKARLAKYKAEHKDPLLEEIEANAKAAKAEMEEAEELLRDAAGILYLMGGSKKPIDGVEIKEVDEIDFDSADALEWAHRHKVCLLLDLKNFGAIAKSACENRLLASAMDLEFVSFTKRAKVFISSSLPAPEKIEPEAGKDEIAF